MSKVISRAALAVTIACLYSFAPAAETITHPFSGVTLIVRTETMPRPQNMHIIEIDLSDPAIHFKLSPAAPPPNSPNRETRGQTTLAFVEQEHAQVGINAHFFDFPPNADGGTNLTGFAASMGHVYSAFESNPVLNYAIVPNSPVLHIDSGNHATIALRGSSDTSLVDAGNSAPLAPFNDLCGSAQIITDGVKTIPRVPTKPNTNPPLQWYTDQITARSAIGLSRDGRTLFLFTVDAAGGSLGMSVDEMADFLRTQYPIHNALNLDGGGSTTLVMEDPVTRVASVINASSGGPRAVGSSLAIFAGVSTATIPTTLAAAPPSAPPALPATPLLETPWLWLIVLGGIGLVVLLVVRAYRYRKTV